MDSVIREGALRLQTTETSCDVVLSCRGSRLMAHRLILSIASPVLRDLLLEDSTDTTVLILPDINFTIMSSILDYIYTGSVVIYSNLLDEFISVASLLKIQIDYDYRIDPSTNNKLSYKVEADQIINKKEEHNTTSADIYSRKNLKKLPNLVPLNSIPMPNNKVHRRLCGLVIPPSPWCPRIESAFDDPRKEYLENFEKQIFHKLNRNDKNNNFQYATSTPPYYTPQLNTVSNPYSPPIEQCSKHIPHPAIAIPVVTKTIPEKVGSTPLPFNETECQQNIVKDNSDEKLDKCTEEILDTGNNNNNVITNNNNNNVDEISEEKNTCSKQKPFRCSDCGKCFSQLRNYKYHRSVHEGTKEFAAKCPECGKVFNDKGYLSSHMKIHRDRKEYACPHCPKRFNQRVAYNMHLRIHTGIKPHECVTCGKSFSRKMLLKQHQRVHTGERPYSCPECGKTFADRSNMSLHARLHTGVKPYACNLCPKSFTKKHHLKTHMNFHTGLKPYTCEKCGLAFSQSSNMRTHYKKCILKDDASLPNNSTTSSTSSLENNEKLP